MSNIPVFIMNDGRYVKEEHFDAIKSEIKKMEDEIKRLRLEKYKINDELSTLQTKMRLANAQKYFRDNGCIWYVDGIFNPRGWDFQQMCSWRFMPTDIKLQYYDVDHNPINHDYYDHPIYKSKKWSKSMDTITPETVDCK